MKWDEKRYLEIVMETDWERDVERVRCEEMKRK